MPGIASSSPPVLVAHLAASTKTIRVGAGGVMLPNHASLVVAEQFGMLEALHPGPHRSRARTGAGHRPRHRRGVAAQSVSGGRRVPGAATRPVLVLRRRASADHRGARVAATAPRCGCSARVISAPASPARSACRSRSRITSRRTTRSPRSRSTEHRFVRRVSWSEPYAMIGVPVICAETAERARWLSGPSALVVRPSSPGPADTAPDSRGSRRVTCSRRPNARSSGAGPRRSSAASPSTCATELEALAQRTGADELMITTMIHGPADRLRSYELVAETWNRASVAPGIPEATL